MKLRACQALLTFNSMLWIQRGNIGSSEDTQTTNFQLHVMDSPQTLGVGAGAGALGALSTPCYGFCTMGGVVLVYPAVITYFY